MKGIDRADIDKCLDAFRNGHEWAFDTLYRVYYVPLVNYSNRIVHDRQSAESIAQNLFLKIWEQRGTLRINVSAEAYLFRAVYHASLNHISATARMSALNDRQREFYLNNVVQSPEAEQALADADISEAMERAIGMLPVKCREIFIKSKVEGFKNREIASDMGISEKTVESQMSIALRRLRTELQWLLVFTVAVAVI